MTDWANQHAYHPATAQTAPLHDKMRQACIDLAQQIEVCVPPGFEHDEAQKALQLVRMWSNAGIAIRLAEPATEEQRTTPQPSHGQDDKNMICPNCQHSVTKRPHGHVNPHWAGFFTCKQQET